MRKSRLLSFLCLLATSLVLWVNAVNAAAQDVNDTIREHVERHQMSGRMTLAGVDIAGLDIFWRLYENNDYAPLWQKQERIDDLIGMVGRAEEEGLLPRDYHHETLLTLRNLSRCPRASLAPHVETTASRSVTRHVVMALQLRLSYHMGTVSKRMRQCGRLVLS